MHSNTSPERLLFASMHTHRCNMLLGLILFLATSCRSMPVEEPSADETNALKTQIQSKSPPFVAPETDDRSKLWTATQKVYELRAFRPAWTGPGQDSRVD